MKVTSRVFLVLLSVYCTIHFQGGGVESANILFYFGVASYSHRISVWPLVTELADRGHNITFAATHHVKESERHPKVREFFPKTVEDAMNANPPFKEDEIFMTRVKEGRFHQGGGGKLLDIGVNICEMYASAKETQHLLQTGKFDLIVIDGLFNDCGFGFAYKLNPKPKVILYGTSLIFSWWYEPFGVPSDSSWVSDAIVAFPSPMSFFQRTLTAVLVPVTYYAKVWFYYPRLETLLRETLQIPDMPSIAEIERNTSLILLNSHFSADFARSLPPLFVNVGGLHIKEDKGKAGAAPQKVPADMQKFMDESGDEGFIYVSFGSVAKMSTAPPEIQQVFFDAFRQTKCRFLFKWETERPKELPANVFTSQWMPQQRILSHPRIKAFVTHAGMMSLSEALMNGIPVIMFPIFAEQDFNSLRFEGARRGIRLEISTVTTNELRDAFNEIRTNPVYKASMVQAKGLYKDRQHSPLDTAVWWTEYVLRHDDLSSLKPLSMDQYWFQTRLLDVWAFLAGLVFVVLVTILYTVKKVLGCIFCRGGGSSPSSSSKKKATTAGGKGGNKVKRS